MKFFIRPFEERDVRGLNEIRRMRGVREGLLRCAYTEGGRYKNIVAMARCISPIGRGA